MRQEIIQQNAKFVFSTHFIIHVPHLIHKHHHTHVKKIYIPVKSDDHHEHHEHEDSW